MPLKRPLPKRNFRKQTRGTEMTLKLIENLLISFGTVTDSLVACLCVNSYHLGGRKKHIQCIQNLPGIALYTVTGHFNRDGVQLPVFRCAQETTSLESSHLTSQGVFTLLVLQVQYNIIMCSDS